MGDIDYTLPFEFKDKDGDTISFRRQDGVVYMKAVINIERLLNGDPTHDELYRYAKINVPDMKFSIELTDSNLSQKPEDDLSASLKAMSEDKCYNCIPRYDKIKMLRSALKLGRSA